MISRFWAVTWYELKMRWRSWGYWLVVLLVNAWALFVASPLNYRSDTDWPYFRSSWWMAGQAFNAATMLMAGLGAFLVADRMLRDRMLQTGESLRARGVFPGAYVLGKWAASALSLGLAVCPVFVGTPLVQWHVSHTVPQLGPFFLGWAAEYVPVVLFVSALALSAATLLGDARLFYVPYLVVWYLDSFQWWVPRPAIREVLNFNGTAVLFGLIATHVPDWAARYPSIATWEALLNLGLLVTASGALLLILWRRERGKWLGSAALQRSGR